MFIMYMTAIIVLICIALFTVAAFFGKKVEAERERAKNNKEKDNSNREMEPLKPE